MVPMKKQRIFWIELWSFVSDRMQCSCKISFGILYCVHVLQVYEGYVCKRSIIKNELSRRGVE